MHLRWLASALLLLSAAVFAQSGIRIAGRDPAELIEAKNAVRLYCEMDAQGFRLKSDSAKRLQAITTWKALPDWQGFDVISAFEIGSARKNARGWLVTVSYAVLGRFEIGVGYAPRPQVLRTEMQAVENGGAWKVLGSDDLITPRIARMRTVKWLRDQLATERDPEWKRTLQQAVEQLQ